MFDAQFLDAAFAFFSVILIDITLSADNAIVIGLAVAGLPEELRKKAVMIGIVAATGLRVVFAAFTTQLLQIVGLTLAGGILLLWVSWKMWRELRSGHAKADDEAEAAIEGKDVPTKPGKSLRDAITQIVIADVSMSLDNVLAVAGAALDHPWIMVMGLLLSIALMGAAAQLISKLLHRYHWIAYVGLAIIFYVALSMIWRGGETVRAAVMGG